MRLALILLIAPGAWAQREHPEHPSGPVPAAAPAAPPVSDSMAPGGGDEGASPAEPGTAPPPPPIEEPRPEPPRGPMSAEDARVNLPTVVETYIREQSPQGYLPIRDKKGRTWRLLLERIDEDSIRPAGRDRYQACVKMRTAPDGPDHRLDVDFTADFSGPSWKVSSVAIHSISGHRKPQKPSRKRSPRKKG